MPFKETCLENNLENNWENFEAWWKVKRCLYVLHAMDVHLLFETINYW